MFHLHPYWNLQNIVRKMTNFPISLKMLAASTTFLMILIQFDVANETWIFQMSTKRNVSVHFWGEWDDSNSILNQNFFQCRILRKKVFRSLFLMENMQLLINHIQCEHFQHFWIKKHCLRESQFWSIFLLK